MSTTGENEQGLRQIIDLTRFGSIFILLLHFYFYCYGAFNHWGIKSGITDRLLQNIMHTGLFKNLFVSKLIALALLLISLLGAQGKKDQKIHWKNIIVYLSVGLLLFLCSGLLFKLKYAIQTNTGVYMIVTSIGFLLVLAGVNSFSRLTRLNISGDIFNSLNETFPYEQRLFHERVHN